MKPSGIVDVRSTPYRGLRPYLATDADFFFGRKREVRQLMASVFSNALTVVYGPSGVGKSSVLNAGLLHEIDRRGDLIGVVYNSWSDGNAMQAVATRIRQIADDAGLEMNVDSSPIGQLEVAARALEERETNDGSLRRPMVVVLDQFEDYTKYCDRSPDFHDQFAALVSSLGRSISVVVSIREDNVTLLDQFKGDVPALFENYLRIAYLDREQAMDAIVRPLAKWSDRSLEEVVVEAGSPDEDGLIEERLIGRVLDDVSVGATDDRGSLRPTAQRDSGRIETAYLQLVMATLWEQREGEPMSVALYEKLGEARRISRNHVSGVMNDLTQRERQLASLMVPHLVTASGLKLAQHAKDIADRVRRDPSDLSAVLAKLEEGGRILRVLDPPDTEGVLRRYEPYHDRIAEALIQWKDLHDADDPAERYRRRLRNQITAAVANANDPENRKRVLNGIERLGSLMNNPVDREIAEQALDELRKLKDRPARGKFGVNPFGTSGPRERVSELLESRYSSLANLMVSDIQGALSSMAAVLDSPWDGAYEDAVEEIAAGGEDLESQSSDADRLGNLVRARVDGFATREHLKDKVDRPPGQPLRNPFPETDLATLREDIDDVVSLATELAENAKQKGSLGAASSEALDALSWSSYELDHVVETLRSLEADEEADRLERARELWPTVDEGFDVNQSWLRFPVLVAVTWVGAAVGAVSASRWLGPLGLPALGDLAWPFGVFVLITTLEGLFLADETYRGELIRNASWWTGIAAIGWPLATCLALMVHVTFGVGILWPLWIALAPTAIAGGALAVVLADY